MKAQTAMEYLITYGWAILIIAVVIAVLFMLNVFNPSTFLQKASPGSCSVYRPGGPGTSFDISTVGTCTNDIPQYVAKFNGNNSYIQIPNNRLLNKDNITVSFWVNPSLYGNGKDGATTPTNSTWSSIIIGHGYIGMWWFEFRDNNALDFYVNASSNTGGTINTAVGVGNVFPNLNRWYMITGVVSSNTNTSASIYIDGQLIDNNTFKGNIVTDNNNIIIGSGKGSNCTADEYGGCFSGEISNIQIYNTALSAGDIKAIYQEGIGGNPINLRYLAGWWQLNGNANDYGGNGYNGTGYGVMYITNWEGGYSI